MYTVSQLLADAAKRWGAITKSGGDLQQVWDAFNRYVTAIVEKRQTLNVPNFCRIGWKVEEQAIGKNRMRPHFQLADSFIRANGLNTRSSAAVQDKYFTTMEDFNFSKAALRYSQGLTKDTMFMGLRAIFHMLGEAIGAGHQISIDFEVGQLLASDKSPRFAFLVELYLQEGLEVPDSAVKEPGYVPSASFAPPSKDALSLALQGSSHFSNRRTKATSFGGWTEAPDRPSTSGGHTAAEFDFEPRPSTSIEGSRSSGAPRSDQDVTIQQALAREITVLSREAAAVIADKEDWEQRLKQCAHEDRQRLFEKQARAQVLARHLEDQIRRGEARRVEDRAQDSEEASARSFPSFTEVPEAEVHEYISQRKKFLKADLDQQVDFKHRVKTLTIQQDKQLEVANLTAIEQEIAVIKQEAQTKKQHQQAALWKAWDTDCQIRDAKKAIKDYPKAPARSGLVELVATLQQAVDRGSPHCSPKSASMPQTFSPETPRSRPPTGSVRRMPLGAAASLALHKEKMKAMKL